MCNSPPPGSSPHREAVLGVVVVVGRTGESPFGNKDEFWDLLQSPVTPRSTTSPQRKKMEWYVSLLQNKTHKRIYRGIFGRKEKMRSGRRLR